VHLFGPVALTRAVLPHMRSRGLGGRPARLDLP
jgi:hypothetical protein